jgi:large subunit ribosomal protein L10
MTGPLAFAVSADPVAAAKILSEFAKDNEALKIKAGAMGGKLMSLEQIKALAVLPGREQLLAQLLGTMQAPVQKFVQTLNEVPAKFVRALAAVRDAKANAA